MKYILMVLITINLIAGIGCAGASSSTNRSDIYKSGSTYETLRTPPTRQTESARLLNAQAVDFVRAGDFDKAETLLKQALTADVTFGPAHNNLGKVYFHQREFYLAAWEFRYAMGLMPTQAEPKNNLGLVYEIVGKLDEAVEVYAQANDAAPDSADYLGNLARARIRRGDRDQEVREILTDLLFKETRPEWVEWAQLEIARINTP